MTTPRHLRVSQSIKRELSEIIRREIKDARLADIVSITDVESSNDCRRAKAFVSIFADEEKQESTMAVLNEHVGMIRGELCRRLKLRFAPELTFTLDTSLERGSKVSDLISKISRGEI